MPPGGSRPLQSGGQNHNWPTNGQGGYKNNHPPNSAKKSQQFRRTIRRAYFSAKCFPVTRIMALGPQAHCPFGCCVVRDMWKPLEAEKKIALCWFYKTKNGVRRAKITGYGVGLQNAEHSRSWVETPLWVIF